MNLLLYRLYAYGFANEKVVTSKYLLLITTNNKK